jgi:hypothetical protein
VDTQARLDVTVPAHWSKGAVMLDFWRELSTLKLVDLWLRQGHFAGLNPLRGAVQTVLFGGLAARRLLPSPGSSADGRSREDGSEQVGGIQETDRCSPSSISPP